MSLAELAEVERAYRELQLEIEREQQGEDPLGRAFDDFMARRAAAGLAVEAPPTVRLGSGNDNPDLRIEHEKGSDPGGDDAEKTPTPSTSNPEKDGDSDRRAGSSRGS